MGKRLTTGERIAAVGVGALVVYAVVRDLFKGEADPGIVDIDVADAGPRTLSDNQLVIMADALEAGLLGGWLGEDEESIFAVMGLLRTDGDVAALVAEFGVRCEGVVIQRCGSLPQWFSIYLSTAEIATINELMAAQGITYRF